MSESKRSSSPGKGGKKTSEKSKNKDSVKKSTTNSGPSSADRGRKGEVLLSVGGLKYTMPGKRQRVVIGSIVLGLNLLLVVAVLLYFYNPSFQEFIYTVGRS